MDYKDEKRLIPGISDKGYVNSPSTNLRILNGLKKLRELLPGERQFFEKNPNVSGMATADNKVIINPYSNILKTEQQKKGLYHLENARLHMKNSKNKPNFKLTPEQEILFKNYSPNLQDKRETIASRIYVGDTSEGLVTPDQAKYVDELIQEMKKEEEKERLIKFLANDIQKKVK